MKKFAENNLGTRLRRIFGVSLLALMLLITYSCGGSKPEAPAPQQRAKPKPAEVAPAPKAEAEEQEKVGYSYNPIGKRDPFQEYVLVDPLKPKDTPLTPLQRYSIDQLKLVGIIWGISNPRAMVEDPGGKGHVIKKGTLIGKNWGKVARIKQDEVIIAEEYRDFEGRVVVNEISLKLPKTNSLEEEQL